MKSSLKDKIDIVFYADFGSWRGGGKEVSILTESLFKGGLLGKVFVRDRGMAKGTKFDKYVISSILGGNFFPRFLSGMQKFIYRPLPARSIGEKFFEIFTNLRFSPENKIVFMALPIESVLKKAKKAKVKTINYSRVLHPVYNLTLIQEEFARFM